MVIRMSSRDHKDVLPRGLEKSDLRAAGVSRLYPDLANASPVPETWASSLKSRWDHALSAMAQPSRQLHPYNDLDDDKLTPALQRPSRRPTFQTATAGKEVDGKTHDDGWLSGGPNDIPRSCDPKPEQLSSVQLPLETAMGTNNALQSSELALQRSDYASMRDESNPAFLSRSTTVASSVYSDASGTALMKPEVCSYYAATALPLRNVPQNRSHERLDMDEDHLNHVDPSPETEEAVDVCQSLDERKQLRLRRKKSNALGLHMH